MSERSEAMIIDMGIRMYWELLGSLPGSRLSLGDISYVKADGIGPERIFSVDLSSDDREESMQRMIAEMKAGMLPSSLLISPLSQPEDLALYLADRGFDLDSSGQCMLLPLQGYQALKSCDDHISIERVSSEHQLADWLNIVNSALTGSPLFSHVQATALLNHENVRLYLGCYQQQPASVCMTYCRSNTSVIELVATMPEFRRRGIASAAVDHALCELFEQGISSASLRADADGIGLYRNLGFRTCFRRVVASVNWDKIYREACPCAIEKTAVDAAWKLYTESSDLEDFAAKLAEHRVIGREIWYQPEHEAIYIVKKYADECGGGCPSNDTLIGRRCHCRYIHHLSEVLSIDYCRCSAAFFEPMFRPIFGDDLCIEPIETVLSGGKECIFRITQKGV